MEILLKILFALFLIGVGVGIYLQIIGDQNYQRVFGVSIISFAFIFMPLFIYYRYKKGKYKKYVLDPKSKNPFKIEDESKL